jgi:hypothetical protein
MTITRNHSEKQNNNINNFKILNHFSVWQQILFMEKLRENNFRRYALWRGTR